jgi:hypothetical protein
MSERLRHLQHQQALLREHLAWIDREITREAEQSALTPLASTTVAAPSFDSHTEPGTQPPLASETIDADALLERYAADQRQNPQDIRRGCLLIFFAALLLLIGGVALAWFAYYRQR